MSGVLAKSCSARWAGGAEVFPWKHAAAPGPGVVMLLERFDELGVLGGEVVGFGAVGIKVVEFPRGAEMLDELPLAVADGAVAFVFPEEEARCGRFVFAQKR